MLSLSLYQISLKEHRMNKNDLIVIAGAGGFIGGHLTADLLKKGFTRLRAIDQKPSSQWYRIFPEAENRQADLKEIKACDEACKGARYVFNLAADMGGMGFIETHKAECMLSVLINTHLLLAAQKNRVERFFLFFGLRLCRRKATCGTNRRSKEEDAYPAMPEDGYGWEKLFSERDVQTFS